MQYRCTVLSTELSSVQVAPESVEVHTLPPVALALEEVMLNQGSPMSETSVQVAPESLEVQMFSPISAPAASFAPSLEKVMLVHAFVLQKEVTLVHVAPESVEVHIFVPRKPHELPIRVCALSRRSTLSPGGLCRGERAQRE